MSGAFDEKGNVRLSERVKALPPWPIMGYDMPRTMRGEVMTKLAEIKLGNIIITIRRKRWEEKRIGGA
jgi:hypothetical protein